KRRAQQAHGIVVRPVIGRRLTTYRQAFAQQRLSLGPFVLGEEVAAEVGEFVGQQGAVGLGGLAADGQSVAAPRLGVGPAAERLVSVDEAGAALEGVGMVGAQLRCAALERLLAERDRLPAERDRLGRSAGLGQQPAQVLVELGLQFGVMRYLR